MPSTKKLMWNGLLLALIAVADPVAARTIVDTAGRTVEVPTQIERVATIGAVPVINSFVFAVGQGDKIVNGLPSFVTPPRDGLQLALAPQIKTLPSAQNDNRQPNLEVLLQLHPDVVLTMDANTAAYLERHHLPTLLLDWRDVHSIGHNIRLLGELFNVSQHADAYRAYFDNTLETISTKVGHLAETKRIRALYCQCRSFSQPHKVADWWISAAGAISVTAGERISEAYAFSAEDLLRWNPDVIIAVNADDADFLRHDIRFANLNAVRHQHITVVPTGLHTWGHRTIEQPLTVLWAAQLFYPQYFSGIDISTVTQEFYRHYLSYPISNEQVKEILNGQAH